MWSGERTEVDVLSLLWLGISNPKGSSFPEHQLAEERKETLGGVSRRRPEIASSISYLNGLKKGKGFVTSPKRLRPDTHRFSLNGKRILITLTHLAAPRL